MGRGESRAQLRASQMPLEPLSFAVVTWLQWGTLPLEEMMLEDMKQVPGEQW